MYREYMNNVEFPQRSQFRKLPNKIMVFSLTLFFVSCANLDERISGRITEEIRQIINKTWLLEAFVCGNQRDVISEKITLKISQRTDGSFGCFGQAVPNSYSSTVCFTENKGMLFKRIRTTKMVGSKLESKYLSKLINNTYRLDNGRLHLYYNQDCYLEFIPEQYLKIRKTTSMKCQEERE